MPKFRISFSALLSGLHATSPMPMARSRVISSNVVLVNPNSETATALPTLMRGLGPGVRPSLSTSESSSQQIAIDIPAAQVEDSSATVSRDDTVGNSVSTESVTTDNTKPDVAIHSAASSNCKSTTSQIASVFSTTTASSNSVIAHSNSADHPSESTPSGSTPSNELCCPSTEPSDMPSHPSVLPDEFYLQCVFCFNEFEETHPTCLDARNDSSVSTRKDSTESDTIFQPSIITPCGHKFHIECLKKDCDIVLKTKKKATTTRQSEESKEEPLTQCPHPFCQKNLSKSWALENGLIHTEAEDARNSTRDTRTIRRIEFEDSNTNEDSNFFTMRQVFYIWFCVLGLLLSGVIAFVSLVYAKVIHCG